MHHKQLNVRLRGVLEGKTTVLNKKYSFIDGMFYAVMSPVECDNLSRFFDASYNCEITITMPGEAPVVVDPDPVPEDVVMTERQEKILEAVGAIDTDDWIQDVVPHPSVVTIAELLEDSTITKEEVVAVIEQFMDDTEVPTEDDLEDADVEPEVEDEDEDVRVNEVDEAEDNDNTDQKD